MLRMDKANVFYLDDLQHSLRVANLALKLSEKVNLSQDAKKNIYLSAILHDIGKAYISRNILYKQEPLSEYERHIIELHPIYSALDAYLKGYSEEIVQNILYHHECFDGSGYPSGIKGADIPIGARIIKICDVYDALVSDRPYRKALSCNEALSVMEMEKQKYDPFLYNTFINNVDIFGGQVGPWDDIVLEPVQISATSD